MVAYIASLHTVSKIGFELPQGILIDAVFTKLLSNYLMVSSVKSLLQINEDYAVEKTTTTMTARMRNLKFKSPPTVPFSLPSINVAEVLGNE